MSGTLGKVQAFVLLEMLKWQNFDALLCMHMFYMSIYAFLVIPEMAGEGL